ncbi:MAG: SAM hydrolase/SAM-dependent halogenase family protein [Terriglobia bacterium]
MPQQSIVTLTTDFGLADHFVATMKGVMFGINPLMTFVDISHQVASHDVFDGALTLGFAYSYFPAGTIHLVVVDPGVGSSRRPIIARTAQHVFVAPDNGVLSLVYEREERAEVRQVTSEHYFLTPVSNTFHGRDVFAPVAAWLSKGVEISKFGDVITDYVRFVPPKPRRLEGGQIQGAVIKVDHFGNLLTNIGPGEAPGLFGSDPPHFRIAINGREITALYTSYSMAKPSEVFAIAGSVRLIEICQNRAAAAKTLNAVRGTEVGLVMVR